MPSNILNSLVEYTTLRIDTQENIVPLSSDDIFKCPFCYISGHKLVEFTIQERENFKKYVLNAVAKSDAKITAFCGTWQHDLDQCNLLPDDKVGSAFLTTL